MGQSVDVQVLDSEGDPVAGAHVKIDIEGIWKGGTLEAYTDEDGHAEFETAEDYEDDREVMVYVRGESFGPYDLGEGAFTVTLDE
jgi:hypothetical protein